MRTMLLTGALILLAGASVASAADGARIDLRILDRGAPLAGARVEVFLSCDKMQGTTADDGSVVLQSDCNGGHYWVEIDGRRVDTLFAVDREVRTLDVANVTFRTWQGGR